MKVYELDDSGKRIPLDINEEQLQYILDPKKVLLIVREDLRTIYIWNGPDSPVRMHYIASRVALDLQEELRKYARYHRCKIVSVDAGNEPREFLKAFGLTSEKSTKEIEEKIKNLRKIAKEKLAAWERPRQMRRYDYTFKVMFFGDLLSGKEDLLRKYTKSFGYEDFHPFVAAQWVFMKKIDEIRKYNKSFEMDQTISGGVNFFSKVVSRSNRKTLLSIWDIAIVNERFKFLWPQYCQGSNGAIIMYDITSSNSLKPVPEWIQVIRENAGDIPILLIGNKLDLEQQREISREEGAKFAENYNLSAFREISTKTGENIREAFSKLTECIHNNIFVKFKINDYVYLKLEYGNINIYVKEKLFKYDNVIEIDDTDNVIEIDDIESIDKINISEFFRTLCSNLQVWYENDYDTRLLHYNLAFPLLKALSKAGDPLAKKALKKEITRRLESGYPSVVSYLLNQKYLDYLTPEEINTILENPKFKANLSEYVLNTSTIPYLVLKKIRKLRELKDRIEPPHYDASYKIVVLGEPPNTTELVHRFIFNLYKSDIKMTIGLDFFLKNLEIDKKRVKLQLWDLGPEERFKLLLSTYARGASGALFVYDVNNYSSLAHIDDWLMVIRKERRQEDLFPIIMVGVVSDLDAERQISAEEAKKIAQSNGLDGFTECCPRTGENVKETFETLTRLMLARSGISEEFENKKLLD
ncbi:MAG: GTP-binding protein [Promethearchaeota archaeon]